MAYRYGYRYVYKRSGCLGCACNITVCGACDARNVAFIRCILANKYSQMDKNLLMTITQKHPQKCFRYNLARKFTSKLLYLTLLHIKIQTL